MPAPALHDAYLARLKPDQRDCLTHLRAGIHAEVPGAEERRPVRARLAEIAANGR